jgi:hypothetical protein
MLRLLLPTLPLLAIGDVALLELVILPHATTWIRIPLGLFGPGRPSDHLIVTVDDPTGFLAALTAPA